MAVAAEWQGLVEPFATAVGKLDATLESLAQRPIQELRAQVGVRVCAPVCLFPPPFRPFSLSRFLVRWGCDETLAYLLGPCCLFPMGRCRTCRF
jgi:hypothetical protein